MSQRYCSWIAIYLCNQCLLLPKFVSLILGSKMVIEEGQTTQRPKEKGPYGQTTIYKTLHRKLKIEQHEPH